MIYANNFNSPGTELNRMMDGLGFPDKVGDLYGAALDAAVGNNAGTARNLFDAYSPFTTSRLNTLTRSMAPSAFMPRPNPATALTQGLQGYFGASEFNPAQTQAAVSGLLNRVTPQFLNNAADQLGSGTNGSTGQVEERMASAFAGIMDRLQSGIAGKLNDLAAPAPVKKRKKKGGLKKLGKSLKKKFKSVGKFAKSTLKSAFKTVKGNFGSILKGLTSGSIFQIGQGLAGGLIGGPVGNLVMKQIMKAAGKNNPLKPVLETLNKTLQTVSSFQKNSFDIQRSIVQRMFV